MAYTEGSIAVENDVFWLAVAGLTTIVAVLILATVLLLAIRESRVYGLRLKRHEARLDAVLDELSHTVNADRRAMWQQLKNGESQ